MLSPEREREIRAQIDRLRAELDALLDRFFESAHDTQL